MPLLALFFAWWFAPTIVKSFVKVSFFEFQAPFWTSVSYLHDLQDYWSARSRSKNELIEVGRDLARLNAAYEIHLTEREALRKELRRLERLFDLPSLPVEWRATSCGSEHRRSQFDAVRSVPE